MHRVENFTMTSRKGDYSVDGRLYAAASLPVKSFSTAYEIVATSFHASYAINSEASNFWVCWCVVVSGHRYAVSDGSLWGETSEEVPFDGGQPEWFRRLIEDCAPRDVS